MTVNGAKRRVLIVTGHHFADAPRKVDLHFMADALRDGGDHVDFLVCRLSPFSRFLKDGRFAYARERGFNRWRKVGEHLEEFLWSAPFHPVNLKFSLLNRLSTPLFNIYARFLPKAVMDRLPGYTHILIESGPPPLLTHRIRKAAPDARIIYHAADRLHTIHVHPCIEMALSDNIGDYDLVHIMAEAMRADFAPNVPVFYLQHGIAKDVFDRAGTNPYPQARNAVSVGDMLFDGQAIDTLAVAFPDWTFHLFGKNAVPVVARANVVRHGEVAFEAIVPMIKYAEVGLAPYRRSEVADYLSQSSLKMIQYSYCRLPIVAPRFAAAGRDHVCAYEPDDAQSLVDAFNKALSYDRESIDTASIRSWREAVQVLFDHKDVA